MTATTQRLYTVAESWEESPVDPRDGAWVYTVIHPYEGAIKEHRWYAAALRHADTLNTRAALAARQS